jgi:hypothetical protein
LQWLLHHGWQLKSLYSLWQLFRLVDLLGVFPPEALLGGDPEVPLDLEADPEVDLVHQPPVLALGLVFH